MSPTPLPRPSLLPGLPRIWRSPHKLQLGVDPPRAVLVELPDPKAAALLDLLDGSRSERLALTQAGALGIRPEEARHLLDKLHAVGLVVSAQNLFPPSMPDRLTAEASALAYLQPPTTPARTMRRRAAARIVITGRPRLAPGVAVALAEAGVGHVHPDLIGAVDRHEPPGGPLTPADIGRPRAEAVAEAIQRAAPGTETRPVRRGSASLVIRLGEERPVDPVTIGLAQRRQPYLTASIREGKVLVGPLMRPGISPCPNCITLHMRDRENPWPPSMTPGADPADETTTPTTGRRLRAPGSGAGRGGRATRAQGQGDPGVGAGRDDPASRESGAGQQGPASDPDPQGVVTGQWIYSAGPPEPCPVATMLAATAYITAEALDFLDGEFPEIPGMEVELSRPGTVRYRTWDPHPLCPCVLRTLPPLPRRVGIDPVPWPRTFRQDQTP